MDWSNLAEVLQEKEQMRRAIGKESLLLPRLLENEDLIHAPEGADTVDRETLTNTLNHIHFVDGHVLVLLRHPKYQQGILIRANPGPCLGREVVCRWSDETFSDPDLENYQFLQVIIDDGLSVTLVPGICEEINRNALIIRLPDTSYSVKQRQARRYACSGVVVELIQNGFQARGELMDFSSVGFRIRVSPVSPGSFYWFNSDAPATIHLWRDQEFLFSGSCRCIRQHGNLLAREIVLAPAHQMVNRFEKRPIRNPRLELVPSPTLIFEHSLLKKMVRLKVSDISTSGCSVYEETKEGILIQGMLIPELTIDFNGAFSLKCSAQVIYRLEEAEKGIRCGLGILDMDIFAYSRLANLITNALDPHAYVSSDIDIEALWEFFFKSGFIYPMKYRYIQSQRASFKEKYKKFYQDNPEIARHFTYQKNGQIYGNISLVRAYERAWLIQHHSARAINSKRVGFLVLQQIIHFINDMRRLPSAEIDYAMTYFQPDKKIPYRIFGGFTEFLKDPRGSSLELFSYLHYTRMPLNSELPAGWSLSECSARDLWELSRFYNRHSGGLLLDALNLKQDKSDGKFLEELYRRLGFLRKINTYSLKYEGELNAVLIDDQSDPGLNLSELLNCVKVLVTNPEGLPWEILSTAIGKLTNAYPTQERVPLLLCPPNYLKAQNVPHEKQYQLWILNLRYGNQYMEYMQRKFRIGYK
jgi:hypothetical protein